MLANKIVFTLMCLMMLSGCASLLGNVTSRFSDGLSSAMLNHDDPEVVRGGAPSYLLLIDGLIESSPENDSLLRTGAQLYAAYAGTFVDDPDRALKLAARARRYANRAVCLKIDFFCGAEKLTFDAYLLVLEQLKPKNKQVIYSYAASWATWIQANSGDWNAIADIPKVKATMVWLVSVDSEYEQGSVHLYLGVLNTYLPPSFGGQPELGREHFEQAIELSDNQNLLAKVLMAKHYARLVFNQDLHDKLLNEVIHAEVEARGFTLINTLAKQQAKILLDGSNEYF